MSKQERERYRKVFKKFVSRKISREEFEQQAGIPKGTDYLLKMNPRDYRRSLPPRVRREFDKMVNSTKRQLKIRFIDAEFLVARYFVQELNKERK